MSVYLNQEVKFDENNIDIPEILPTNINTFKNTNKISNTCTGHIVHNNKIFTYREKEELNNMMEKLQKIDDIKKDIGEIKELLKGLVK